MANIKVGDFSKVLQKEMQAYTREVSEGITKVAGEVAKQGAKELQEISKSAFKTAQDKPYHKGWSVKNETSGNKISFVIHNKTKPGLAHLLEHGHAKVNGGRVAGKIHIKPIEEKLVKDYEENVIAIIERGY